MSYHLLDEIEHDYEGNLGLQESMGGAVLVGVSDIDVATLPCADVECCPVCMESATTGRRTLCGHVYCAPCIVRWLADHKRCPVCNTDLEDSANMIKPPTRVRKPPQSPPPQT